MSFRFSKMARSGFRSAKCEPVKDVVQRITVDDAGVRHVSFVNVDNVEVTSKIPKPADYSLENLLKAGVPLKPVDSRILSERPSDAQVEAVLDKVESADNVNVDTKN